MQQKDNRSLVMQNMYPINRMLDVHGTTSPTLSERARSTQENWIKWKDTAYSAIGEREKCYAINIVRVISKRGWYYPYDYIYKYINGGFEVRFLNNELLGEFLVLLAEEKIAGTYNG